MLYLSHFQFPNIEREYDFTMGQKRTCYDTFYPFDSFRQQELLRFLEDSVRFFGCQFVIATHSPFLLSMKGVKIYDMDEEPVDVKPWTQLANVRAYYDFFKEHEGEF